MTYIVPTEGLDYLVNILIKAGEPPATLYLGLFTSQTATTCPAAGTVLANAPTGVTEAAFTSYVRVAVAAGDWGTIGDVLDDTARGAAAAQKSFAAAGATSSTAINGFFLATASDDGVAVLYSNFDDETAVASLALGDIIRVTPTFGLASGV